MRKFLGWKEQRVVTCGASPAPARRYQQGETVCVQQVSEEWTQLPPRSTPANRFALGDFAFWVIFHAAFLPHPPRFPHTPIASGPRHRCSRSPCQTSDPDTAGHFPDGSSSQGGTQKMLPHRFLVRITPA